MHFKEISSILPGTKDPYSNNPYELFQLRIGYTCGFDPNTEFSRPLLKTHVVCVKKHSNIITTIQWCSTIKNKNTKHTNL